MGPDAMIFVFWMSSFKPTFSLSSFTFIKRLFSSSSLFPIWNQSVVPCPVLTVASWFAYRFFKRQIRWSGVPISLRISSVCMIQTVKGFGISRSRCFSKNLPFLMIQWMLAIWSPVLLPFLRKFTVHVLLKHGLENFEHYLASMWDECSCVVIWHSSVLPFIGIGLKTDLFQSCGHC